MHGISPCTYDTRWARRHPAEKLSLAGGLLLLAVGAPPWPTGALVLGTATLLAIAGARVPPGRFLVFLALPAGFVLPGSLVLALTVSAGPSGPVLAFDADGMETALALCLRTAAAVSCLSLLVLTTPPVEVLSVLRRVLPAAVMEVGFFTYRFVFILAATARAMHQAQAARLGYTSIRRTYRSLGLLASSLFVHAIERARRMEAGLAARGYTGEARLLSRTERVSARALVAIGALVAGVGGLGFLLA